MSDFISIVRNLDPLAEYDHAEIKGILRSARESRPQLQLIPTTQKELETRLNAAFAATVCGIVPLIRLPESKKTLEAGERLDSLEANMCLVYDLWALVKRPGRRGAK